MSITNQRTRDYIKNFSYLFDIPSTDINEYHLNHARGTGKNKQIAPAITHIGFNRKNTEIMAIRRNATDLKRLKGNFDNGLDFWNKSVPYTGTDKAYSLPNGNKIKLESVYNSQGKKALSGYEAPNNITLLIVWIDEATELSDSEMSQLRQALRLNNGGRVVFIWSSNPHSKGNHYVRFVSKLLPKEPAILRVKEPREMKEVIEVELNIGNGEKSMRKHFIHYANTYINPLQPIDFRTALEQDAETNPHLEDTILYGLDGNPQGSVYPKASEWVITQEIADQVEPRDYMEFAGGVDYGVKDATAGVFGGYTQGYSQVSIIDEYYHQNSNKVARKSLPEYARDLVQFYSAMWEKWEVARVQPVLYVFTDYAKQSVNDPTFWKLCNDTARANGIDYIEFVPATKAKIQTRIIMINSLGESEKLVLFPNTHNLQRELESLSFKEGTEEREDGDDHITNAMEYMLEARRSSIWTTASHYNDTDYWGEEEQWD